MRKLLFTVTLIVIGTAGPGTLTAALADQIICSPNSTEQRVYTGFESCRSDCKKEAKDKIEGCNASCTRTMDICLKQVKDEAKKREEENLKNIHCHDPAVACMHKCYLDTKDEKKCEAKCGGSDAEKKFKECIKK